jgi:hypothetical protein
MFVRSHGSKAMVSEFVNKETGETFTKVVFPNAKFTQGDLAGKTLTASWGKSLAGGLTAQQVAQQKDQLQVIELDRPEHYMVCRQGQLQGEVIDVEW